MDCHKTTWNVDLPRDGSVLYQGIVDALERDVAAGKLSPGQKLPTHRDLASQLGIALGTVSRAYAEAKRRGIITSSVGSGTYVRPHPLVAQRLLRRNSEQAGFIDLSFNGPILANIHDDAMQATLVRLARGEGLGPVLGYHRPWIGSDRHRSAGADWLRRFGCPAETASVALVGGAQHAACVTLLSIAAAGDIVVSDELTDPVTKLLTGALGLVLKGIAMDADGLLPDAFDEACRLYRVKALICSPDHHSPTLAVMPVARRQEIVDIARRHDVWILENAVYRPFAAVAPPPLAALAPEIVFYYTSFSKALAAGLRIGFLSAPLSRLDELVLGMGATIWMVPPLIGDVARDWIESGVADRLVAWQRDELAKRNVLAREVLKTADFASRPSGLHLWLQLPSPWRPVSFAEEARTRQVLVTPSEVFTTERAAAPNAVRVSLGGAVRSRDELVTGLNVLADLLARRVDSFVGI